MAFIIQKIINQITVIILDKEETCILVFIIQIFIMGIIFILILNNATIEAIVAVSMKLLINFHFLSSFMD